MIREGITIKGFTLPEPVEVKKVEELGKYVHVVGVTIYSNTHVDQLNQSQIEIEKEQIQ
jgi:hypothetical protein